MRGMAEQKELGPLEQIPGSWVPSDPTYLIGLQGCPVESILMLLELFVKASPLTAEQRPFQWPGALQTDIQSSQWIRVQRFPLATLNYSRLELSFGTSRDETTMVTFIFLKFIPSLNFTHQISPLRSSWAHHQTGPGCHWKGRGR